MSLYDMAQTGRQTPAHKQAARLTRTLTMLRQCLKNCGEDTVNAPGGRAEVAAEYGAANCQEAVDAWAAMVALVNAHLPPSTPAAVAPLVQGDVPA